MFYVLCTLLNSLQNAFVYTIYLFILYMCMCGCGAHLEVRGQLMGVNYHIPSCES